MEEIIDTEDSASEEVAPVALSPEDMNNPMAVFLWMMAEAGLGEWIWAFVHACSRHGVFHCDTKKCVLARPVNSSLPIDDLNSLVDLDGVTHPPEVAGEHDAWLVMFAAGDMSGFFELAPYELPSLLWQRDGRTPARIYNFSKFKNRIHVLTKNTNSPNPAA